MRATAISATAAGNSARKLSGARAFVATLVLAALLAFVPGSASAPVQASTTQHVVMTAATDGSEALTAPFGVAFNPSYAAVSPSVAIPTPDLSSTGLLPSNGTAIAVMVFGSSLLLTIGIALLIFSRPDYA